MMTITDVCSPNSLIFRHEKLQFSSQQQIDENSNQLINESKINHQDNEKHEVECKPEVEAIPKEPEFKPEIVWVKAAFIATIHILAIYLILQAHLLMVPTIVFAFGIGFLGAIGVQVGAHRLWSHRSFKASFGLRVFLCACHTLAAQKTLQYWGKHISNVDSIYSQLPLTRKKVEALLKGGSSSL